MQIYNFPKETHGTRVQVHNMASGSVNTDAPDLGLEVLRIVDRQLQLLNLEVIVFDNGPDTLIWKIRPFDETRPVKIPPPPPKKGTRTTSDRVSTLAASFLRLSDDRIRQAVIDSPDFITSLRSIAASALAQDEEPKRK